MNSYLRIVEAFSTELSWLCKKDTKHTQTLINKKYVIQYTALKEIQPNC